MTNMVRIRGPVERELYGWALDLLSSTLNHSCDPNAFLFFEGRQLRLRSLKRIAPGEELTICYTDPTIEVTLRRAFLQKYHFFDCHCRSLPCPTPPHRS